MKKTRNFPGERELAGVRERLSKGTAAKPLPNKADAVEKLKHSLCAEFVKYKNRKKMTQKRLAKELKIDEALVSKIINYSYDEFTVDRLVKYLSTIYPRINVSLLVA
ncbi:MAG: XRE family transcriptional regulator [Nitrospinae bacterium]|nr:XRE family transcriptional regulator [Nitrospinota bacterium]